MHAQGISPKGFDSMKLFRRRITRYGKALLYMLVCGYVLLLAAGLISQSAVSKSVALSSEQLSLEGGHPVLLVGSDSSYKLNNAAEARILLKSLYMDTLRDAPSVLLCPSFDASGDPLGAMEALSASGAFPGADSSSPSSFMGFRATIRLLLCFMNLRQIRRFLMWIILLLFAAVVMSIRRHSSPLMSLLFTAAFLSVNPIVIMSSMQYATCFIIAFAAMLFMPHIGRWWLSEPLCFFVIGGITLYFDYYSFPILTFVLPLYMRLLVRQREGELHRFRDDIEYASKCFAAWLSGYALLWLADIAVTALFCNAGVWANAAETLRSVFSVSDAGILRPFLDALRNLTTIECAICIVGFLLAWPFLMDTRARRRIGYRQGRIFLIVALLPVVWLLLTSNSVAEHGYYEYRALTGTIFGALCFYAKPTHLLEKNIRKTL